MTSIFTNDETPNVFTIEPNVKFLGELANVLNDELFDGDFALSDATILLPTRRAARELASEFLKVRNEQATILPRIRTLGDIDPDDLNLHELDDALQPTISTMARKFLLAKFIQARNNAANNSPSGQQEIWANDSVATLGAADALAELLESAELSASPENPIQWENIHKLVENTELAEHWKLSTDFLQIVTSVYPEYLKAIGLIDPALRRRLAIEKLAATWAKTPPKHPVIIAGSTGAVQSTRGLMYVVSRLHQGAVILPGLDKNMTTTIWKNIAKDHSHPQRAMHDTIAHIGVNRDDVKYWPVKAQADDYLIARRAVLNEALTPQEATADWRKTIDNLGHDFIRKGLEGISIIEADTEDEEATAIALEMRETLENNGETCALITPSADIARRVSSKMERWGIRLNISSGGPISETRLGVFIKLIADFLLDYANPNILAAILAHPFCHFGLSKGDLIWYSKSLELGLLRGARKDDTIAELITRADLMGDKDWKWKSAKRDNAKLLLNHILEATQKLDINKADNMADVAQTLLTAVELVATDAEGNNTFIYKGEAGNSVSSFFSELMENGADFAPNDFADGLNIIKSLLNKVAVRPHGTNPYLAILGPLEARLINFDKLILAGLDEGVWPKPPDIDPFLSRPMRAKLGLQSRDLRLGLSAHDFAQLATNKKVIVTRSARRAGSPTVPSRWLWRLKTLTYGALGSTEGDIALKSGTNSLLLARAMLPQKDKNMPDVTPRPKPPLAARPTQFSATQIETWIRDPYKTYVTKILNLRDLEPIGGEVSAKERGSAIHAAMEIIPEWVTKTPSDPEKTLSDELHKQLQIAGFKGENLAEEMLRLAPTISLICEYEIERLKQNITPFAEKWAKATIETAKGDLEIKAKIDRVDIHKNKDFEIWDFKTGTPPSDPQISSLIAAQLPVTAFILNKTHTLSDDNHEPIAIGNLETFGHIHIGGRNPKYVEYNGGQGRGKPKLSLDDLLTRTETTLVNLYEQYMNPDMPYISKPRPQFVPKVNYEDMTDRLARRAEWASATDTEGGNDE